MAKKGSLKSDREMGGHEINTNVCICRGNPLMTSLRVGIKRPKPATGS